LPPPTALAATTEIAAAGTRRNAATPWRNCSLCTGPKVATPARSAVYWTGKIFGGRFSD
jgi:hypothetical protein